MGRPIINLTEKEYADKVFVREVSKDTCEFMGEWDKHNWDTEQLHKPEVYLPYDFKWLSIERKAPEVFVDDGWNNGWDYFHVPYDWDDNETTYRVYPIWELNKKYRTILHKSVVIKSVKAYKENNKWFWTVSLV
jgi:hypothetical protein